MPRSIAIEVILGSKPLPSRLHHGGAIMPCDHVWLASRNAERLAARRAARVRAEERGMPIRRPNDGMGVKRSRAKFIKHRASQRLLARQRKLRRPFVQGKRRLWGKGPAPSCYSIQETPSASQLAHAGSEAEVSPWSSCSIAACCGTPTSPFAPAGQSPSPNWEPLDTPILDMLDCHLSEQRDRRLEMRERGEFRALVQYAGVSL